MDSFGLPLDFILEELKKENCVVDWIDFFEYSIEKQWKITQTISKIKESLNEVYGKEYSQNVIERLLFYFNKNKE